MKRISICGAPLSGKTRILSFLAKFGKTTTRNFCYNSEYIWSSIFKMNGIEVNILTTQGPLFYEKQVYEFILSASDAVIYVFSAIPNNIPHQESQARFFDKHVLLAKELNKFWDNIYWMIVVNHFYERSIIPPSVLLPESLKKQIINVSLKDEGSLNTLLENIPSLIGNT